MIPYYFNPSEDELLDILSRELSDDIDVRKNVQSIIDDVKNRGDEALYYYAKRFDKVELNDLFVSKEEFDLCDSYVDEKLKKAIIRAKCNIESFHKAQIPVGEEIEIENGILNPNVYYLDYRKLKTIAESTDGKYFNYKQNKEVVSVIKQQ